MNKLRVVAAALVLAMALTACGGEELGTPGTGKPDIGMPAGGPIGGTAEPTAAGEGVAPSGEPYNTATPLP